MNCPRCNSADTRTLATRPRADASTYRRRECVSCNRRWSTVEFRQGDPHVELRRQVELAERALRIATE